tara:strand:- start:3137 stop:5197 length:2061 start_codon:yes stop_codon:yes gene_type:complete
MSPTYSNEAMKELQKKQKSRFAKYLRQQALQRINREAIEQKKQVPASASAARDASPAQRKNARSINANSIGPQQEIAQAGDTVPLLFCKRVTIGGTGYGGTWIQPDLLKQASYNFNGCFLYAISQGNVATTPKKQQAYIGSVALKFLPNITAPTLTQYYKSEAQMTAAKNVCPITSGKIFCDIETAYYTMAFASPKSMIFRYPPTYPVLYQNSRDIVRGVGDTTNTTWTVPGTAVKVFEVDTGIDRTAEYWGGPGGQYPGGVGFTFRFNSRFSNLQLVGGNAVDTVTTFKAAGSYFSPEPNVFTILYGTSEPCVEIYPEGTVDKQTNTSNPASTGDLYGVEREVGVSTVADPTAFPTSYDFTVFSDITFLEIQGEIYDDFQSGSPRKTTRQLSVFYKKGADVVLYSQGLSTTGPSNQFADLAMHLFALIKRANPSNALISQPIDTSNLQALATFAQNIKAFFNGVIDQSVNVIEYVTSMAPFFLLSFISKNGRYSLQPLLPLSSNNIDVSALTPVKTFTEADILPGSFSKVYFDQAQRRDFNVSVIFRESSAQEIGGQRTKTVRFSTTANDAPTEQFDMTDFCTNQEHAEIYAKYELSRRKHSTHSISFDVPLLTTSLIPTQLIRIQRQRINTTGDDRTEIETYQVTNIEHSSDGTTSILAMHFPVNASGISLISNDIVNTAFEVV